MAASQPTRRAAAVWRTARRALVGPSAVPESAVSGTAATCPAREGKPVPETSPVTAYRCRGSGTESGTMGWRVFWTVFDNGVRIGYARAITRAQDH